VVIDAVVSTEDRHFFEHGGVDPIGLARATVADLRGRAVQGGSTITQQYVKNAFVGRQRSFVRKLREAVLAVKLERKYSKRQILERYLNIIYFGRGAYGIEAAAKAYYGKDVGQLGLPEASYLAGLIQSPNRADVFSGPAEAARGRLRRAVALDALVRDRKITPQQRTDTEAIPLSTYVRDRKTADPAVSRPSAAYYVDWVLRQLLDKYGATEVYSGGLRVKTTLDPKLQDAAYQAVYGPQGLVQPGDPAGALVAIDDQGQVKALVGGRDFSTSKVDLALGTNGGGTGRQAGSTFKPYLLAETLRQGYSVQSTFPGPPEVILPKANNGKDYKVENFEREDAGPSVSLVDATAASVNTVYAQLEQVIGSARLVTMAHALGVSSALHPDASLVLGTADVSVLEMASAYSTFADRGVHIDPYEISSVARADGGTLEQARPQRHSVVEAHVTDILTYCLQQVVLRGTGTGAAFGHPLAGKTGTTSDYVDAWFIGYTPKLTVAVWMGYPTLGTRSMLNVHGVKKVNGGSLPAQIFRRFMTAATAGGSYVGDFGPAPTLDGRPLPPAQVTFATTTTLSPTSTVPASTTSSGPPTAPTSALPPSTVPPTSPPTTSAPNPTTTRPHSPTTPPPAKPPP
jgi:penicillin-binding protein 1A